MGWIGKTIRKVGFKYLWGMRWILPAFLMVRSMLVVGQSAYSNEFLQIGVGARAHGLGGSVVASVHDINAAYWNPAGLSFITVPLQLGAMHSEWFGGVGKYDHVGLARLLNKDRASVGSISMVRLAIDQIPNTLNLVAPDGSIQFENVSEFSSADYGFLLSYATAIGNIGADKSNRIGGNIKLIHRLIGPFATAWGFGVDLGFQWERGPLKIGIVGRDLSTTFTGWRYQFTEEQKIQLEKSGNIIPVSALEKTLPSLGAGILYRIGSGESISLSTELGFNTFFDGKRNTPIASDFVSIEPKLGLELAFKEIVYLRAGYGNIQKIKDEFEPDRFNTRGQLYGGVGVNFGKVKIDYALSNIGNLARELNYSHIFSATLNFTRD